MKNKLLLLCAGGILLVFLTYGTYAWYLYFLNVSGNIISSNAEINSYKVGNIEFNESSKGVYDADAKSIEDIDVDKVPPYNFNVINHSNVEKEYTLFLEDVPVNVVDDGCTEETLLSRSDLKYKLVLNNDVVKEDYLSNIKDNILDVRKIDANKTNNYSLKVYIHDEARDWFSKHYHYKVVLKK